VTLADVAAFLSIPLHEIPLHEIPLHEIDIADSPLHEIQLHEIANVCQLVSAPLCNDPNADLGTAAADGAFVTGVTFAQLLAAIPLGQVSLNDPPLTETCPGCTSLGDVPLHEIPLHEIPLHEIPLHEIAGQLAGTQLGNTLLSVIPQTEIGDFVDCTQFADNCASETISQAVSAGAMYPGVTLGDLAPFLSIPLGGAPLHEIPLHEIDLVDSPLHEIPLHEIPLRDTIVDCTSHAALCSSPTATLGDAQTAGAIIGTFADLVAAIPLADVPVDEIPLNGIPLIDVPMREANVLDSPLHEIKLQDIAADGADLTTLVDCTVSSGAGTLCNDPNATLGDAFSDRAFLPDATLADLAPYLPSTFTFGDLLLALVNPDTFPWEQLPYQTMGVQTFADPATRGTQGYTLSFTAGAASANATVTMPSGALYVPGSTSFGPASSSPLPALPDAGLVQNGSQLTWALSSLTPGTPYELHFTVYTSLQVGQSAATATVENGSAAPVSAPPAGASVSEANPGHVSATDPLHVDRNQVTFGYISQPAEVHYYSFDVPTTPGARVVIRLSNVANADDDLVVYAPAGQHLNAAGGIPVTTPPVGDPSSSTQQPDTLQDVPIDPPGTDTVAAISASGGGTPESADLTSNGSGGQYVIQVSGYNGQTSDLPYALRVEVDQPTPQPACQPRTLPDAGTQSPGYAGAYPAQLDPGLNTVFLVNEQRFGDTYGKSAEDGVVGALNNLATISGPPLGIDAAVLPLESSGFTFPGDNETIAQAYTAWDRAPCSPDLADGVVNRIIGLVDSLHQQYAGLKYVVLVGGDDLLPMDRIPDSTEVANEQGFASTFLGDGVNESVNNEYYGALASRDLLSDAPYGTTKPIPFSEFDRSMYVPDLSVGRLVETPQQIEDALSRFGTSNGILDPATTADGPITSLTTGYDFLAAGAHRIADGFTGLAQSSLLFNGGSQDSLISPPAWTRSDLLAHLGIDPPGPAPRIVSLNAHADTQRILPSGGDETDPSTLVSYDDLPSAAGSLGGQIWFSMGCHFGLNASDVVVGSSEGPDWAQRLAGDGAVLLGNSGFGYGDNTAILYSVNLMRLFASHLDGTESIGQAWVDAEKQYWEGLRLVTVYDEKAMEEATFYGLPFYGVGQRPPGLRSLQVVRSVRSVAAPVSSGVDSQPFSFTPTQTPEPDPNHPTYFQGDDGVLGVNGEPLIPVTTRDLTRNGETLHGILITTPLASSDTPDFHAAYSRAVVDNSIDEPATPDAGAPFPSTIASTRSLGSADDPVQQAGVFATGQFTPGDRPGVGTMRLWTTISGQALYSSSTDFTPPTIVSSDATTDGSTATFTVEANDTGGAVTLVEVLYRDSSGAWRSATLTEGLAGTWTGTAAASGNRVEYFVEAENDSGDVGVSTNKAKYFDVQGVVTITLGGTKAPDGSYRGPVHVGASSSTGSPLQVMLDGGAAAPYAGPFTVAVAGNHSLEVTAADGSGSSASFTVAGAPPAIKVVKPADGASYAAGATVDADYSCVDAGGGVATCTGTAADGSPIDTSSPGTRTFTVTGKTPTGIASTTSVTYTVFAPVVPATVTVTPGRPPDANGWYDKPVTFTAAGDPGTGPAIVACDGPQTYNGPDGGSASVTLHCADAAGEVTSGRAMFRYDSTPPSLSTHADVTATTPDPTGTTVAYSPPAASDATSGLAPPVVCLPASGSKLPVGRTTVTCTATDVAGNTSRTTFIVIVQPSATVADLIAVVNGMHLDHGLANDLLAKANAAAAQFAKGGTSAGCSQLDAFSTRVLEEIGQTNAKLTTTQARLLLAVLYEVETTTAGCLSTGSSLPAAEQAVTVLIDAINANVADPVFQNTLRMLASQAGQQAAHGDRAACATLASLVKALSSPPAKKLTAAQVAAITTAANAVQSRLGC
jgi:hypothetical protein